MNTNAPDLNRLAEDFCNDYKSGQENMFNVFKRHVEPLQAANEGYCLMLENQGKSLNNKISVLQSENQKLREHLKSIIGLARDGVRWCAKNGSHQEFIREDNEMINEIEQLLKDKTNP